MAEQWLPKTSLNRKNVKNRSHLDFGFFTLTGENR